MTKIRATSETLERLQAEWGELFSKSGSTNLFLSWDWTEKYASFYTEDEEANVIAIRVEGQLVMIVPFSCIGKTLSFFADPMLADYAGILAATGQEKAMPALVDEMFNFVGWNKAVLGSIRSSSKIVIPFESELDARNIVWRREVICGNPVISTVGSFSEFMSGRKKKKLRQEIRTTTNHLNKEGGWHFLSAKSGKVALQIFDALVRFHTARQAGKAGTSIFDDTANIEFFRQLITCPNSAFQPHLSAVYADGQIVSAAYSVHCGSVFYYWIPSFDPTFRSVSLGKLHIHCLLEICFNGSVECFDFMGGDERYKYQWTETSYDLYRYILHKSKFRAWLDLMRAQLRLKLKKTKSKVPFLENIWLKISKLIQ